MRLNVEIWAAAFSCLAALAAMFALWHHAQGFVPWRADWWLWLARSVAYHRGMPDGMLWPAFGFCITFGIGGLAWASWRLRPSARTIYGDADPDEVHGTARWATRDEISRASLLAGTGATVGSFDGEPLRHNGPEHILAFAPTRSGKGVSLVLPTLLEWEESAVVLDIKGENHALSSGYREAAGHRVLKFEPTAPEGSARFNPLAEIRIGTDYELMDCQNVAAMIIDPDGKGLSDFWMQSGFEWLSASILHVLYRVRIEEDRAATLADVNRIMSAAEFKEEGDRMMFLIEKMTKYKHGRDSVNDEIKRVASKMAGRAREERSGVHSSSLTQLSLYSDPIIARNIGESDFTLADMMNGDAPVTLYIVIPPSDIDRLRPLIRVIFNIMLRRFTSEMHFGKDRDDKGYKHRLLLMLDEFTSIGKLDILEKSLAFMAGYGLKCFIVVQDLTQLQQAYGREESVMSNCHVRVAFAPNKLETAKTLSDMLGKQTIIQANRSRSLGKGPASVSDSLSGTARPLMTPEEIMALPGAGKNVAGDVVEPGEMLVMVAGTRAIRARQRLYFMDDELLERSQMPPPGSPEWTPPMEHYPGYAETLGAAIANPVPEGAAGPARQSRGPEALEGREGGPEEDPDGGAAPDKD